MKLDLVEAIDRFGADAFRFFLLREVPFDGDGNFSWERFEERYNADLANAWGNLVSRSVAMIEKYRGGVTPGAAPGAADEADHADVDAYVATLDGSSGYLLHEALRIVMRMVGRANEFVQSSAPWTVSKDPSRSGQLDAILSSLSRQIARQCVLLAPFMPEKAQAAWRQIGGTGNVAAQRIGELRQLDTTGWHVAKGEPLFPKPVAKAENN